MKYCVLLIEELEGIVIFCIWFLVSHQPALHTNAHCHLSCPCTCLFAWLTCTVYIYSMRTCVWIKMDHERQRVCEAVNRNVQSAAMHTDLPTENAHEAVHCACKHSPEVKEEKSPAVPVNYSTTLNQSNTSLMQALSSAGTVGKYTDSTSFQQVSILPQTLYRSSNLYHCRCLWQDQLFST